MLYRCLKWKWIILKFKKFRNFTLLLNHYEENVSFLNIFCPPRVRRWADFLLPTSRGPSGLHPGMDVPGSRSDRWGGRGRFSLRFVAGLAVLSNQLTRNPESSHPNRRYNYTLWVFYRHIVVNLSTCEIEPKRFNNIYPNPWQGAFKTLKGGGWHTY